MGKGREGAACTKLGNKITAEAKLLLRASSPLTDVVANIYLDY